MNFKVQLKSITPEAEKTIGYIARVSSNHQDNPEVSGLIRYCVKHGHWSILEHAFATMEINTSRMISAQILRHTSFRFQEFSQRYAEAVNYVTYPARRQDTKNRQNSIDDIPAAVQGEWIRRQQQSWEVAKANYDWAIGQGIAKECARAVLPMQTQTKLYMTGSIRSWVHYLQVRTDPSTQAEHRAIALEIQKILAEHLPIVAEAVGWN